VYRPTAVAAARRAIAAAIATKASPNSAHSVSGQSVDKGRVESPSSSSIRSRR